MLYPHGQANCHLKPVSNGVVFVSYSTCVAAQLDGVFYRTSQKYSVTTTQQINKWLSANQADFKAVKIESPDFFAKLS